MKTTNTPKERPILFSGPMVRAILDGRKTQTRRIVRPQPTEHITGGTYNWKGPLGFTNMPIDCMLDACPYGQPGDRLWVKETHWRYKGWISGKMLRDGADTWPKVKDEYFAYEDDGQLENLGWKKYPPIFMPRWASRITLEITAVRVERLQDISEADAIAEGVAIQPDAEIASRFIRGEQGPAQLEYFALWESINGKGSWNENPWVWVIEFQQISQT